MATQLGSRWWTKPTVIVPVLVAMIAGIFTFGGDLVSLFGESSSTTINQNPNQTLSFNPAITIPPASQPTPQTQIVNLNFYGRDNLQDFTARIEDLAHVIQDHRVDQFPASASQPTTYVATSLPDTSMRASEAVANTGKVAAPTTSPAVDSIVAVLTGDFTRVIESGRELVRRTPASATAHADLGVAYLAMGHASEAIAELKRAVELDPNDWFSHERLSTAYVETEEFDKAVVEATRAVSLNGKNPVAHLALGVALGKIKKYSEAVEHLRLAIAFDPSFYWAYVSLAGLLNEQNDQIGSIAQYRRAIEINPDFFWAHFALGVVLIRADQSKEGIEELRLAMKHPEESTSAYFYRQFIFRLAVNRYVVIDGERLPITEHSVEAGIRSLIAEAMANSGQLSNAIVEYRHALNSDPEFLPARVGLAGALLAKGEYDDALAQAAAILATKPDQPFALICKGSALIMKGKIEEALLIAHRVVSLYPNDGGAHNLLALVHLNLREYATAVREYRRGIEMGADNSPIRENLALCLEETGDIDECIVQCRKAIELDGSNSSALVRLGRLLHRHGQKTEAIIMLKRAIAVDAHNTDARIQFAVASLNDGNAEESIEHASFVITNEPENALGHFVLGLAYLCHGKQKNGKTSLQRSIELDSKLAVGAHYILAIIAAGDRKDEEALAHLKTAINIDPSFRETARSDQAWNRVRKTRKFKQLMAEN